MFYVPNIGSRFVATVVSNKEEKYLEVDVKREMTARLALEVGHELVKKFTSIEEREETLVYQFNAVVLTNAEYEKLVNEAFEAGMRSNTTSKLLSRKI